MLNYFSDYIYSQLELSNKRTRVQQMYFIRFVSLSEAEGMDMK
jgi:hypothetical protein